MRLPPVGMRRAPFPGGERGLVEPSRVVGWRVVLARPFDARHMDRDQMVPLTMALVRLLSCITATSRRSPTWPTGRPRPVMPNKMSIQQTDSPPRAGRGAPYNPAARSRLGRCLLGRRGVEPPIVIRTFVDRAARTRHGRWERLSRDVTLGPGSRVGESGISGERWLLLQCEEPRGTIAS